MQKIAYLSGDDTVQLMEKDDAENYRENCYQQLLESTRNEGIVANDEDSEDYESDIALQSGYDADGECQVHDFASIMKQYEAAKKRDGYLEKSDVCKVLSDSERYGYGASCTTVFEQDGKYYVHCSMYNSCD